MKIKGRAAASFVRDALPALEGGDDENWPEWLVELGNLLANAGLLERRRPSSDEPEHEQIVVAARETALVRAVRDELARADVELGALRTSNAFAFVDLSGLSETDSLSLARELHTEGVRSLPLWTRGRETFLGPWSEPGRTACWNCCRLRFGDTLAPHGSRDAGYDVGTVGVVVENLEVALRHSARVPYGCVIVEDGGGSRLHSVVPMPWCEVCGGAASISQPRHAGGAASSLVPEELRILADTRGGIVRRLFIFDGNGDEAAVPRVATAFIGPYRNGDRSQPAFNGEGKGSTRAAAVRSAIGEGLERYSASLWDSRRLTRASARELGKAAFDPRWLVLYDEAQYESPDFPFARFDPDRELDWTEGVWLDTGESVQLPALATHLYFTADPAERFAQTTSNGLAAGTTFEDAALRAVYELIERDAFMLLWLAGQPAVRLAEDGCDAITKRALREVERLGARTELYLIDVGTQHPTVVCLGLGDGRAWPGVTIGLAAHADITVALQRAVLEHGHYGAYVRRLMLEGRHRSVAADADVQSILDHALYYIPRSRVAALDSLRGGTDPPKTIGDLRSSYSLPAELPVCVARLRAAGIRIAAADVTAPDVGLAPVRVVRACGTYLQPIHFGIANRRLQNPRLHSLLSGAATDAPHPVA